MLLRAMEANLAEHASHLHRHRPGMTVDEPGDLVVADSGLTDDTFNIISYARFAPADADRRIASTVDALARTGRPYSWWVGPASTPADLSARLSSAGLSVSEREPAMVAELRDVERAAATVVSDAAGLAAFAAVVAANWDPPAPTVLEFFTRATPWALAPDCPSRYLLRYEDGVPVAAAEVCFAAGVAGIYNVCTLTAWRERGHATHLMRAAMSLARENGFDRAVLQASEDGARVYARLGFEPVGDFVEHRLGG